MFPVNTFYEVYGSLRTCWFARHFHH